MSRGPGATPLPGPGWVRRPSGDLPVSAPCQDARMHSPHALPHEHDERLRSRLMELVDGIDPWDELERAHVRSTEASLWLPTGGHVEPGEDPSDTVERECQEELGIPAVASGLTGKRPSSSPSPAPAPADRANTRMCRSGTSSTRGRQHHFLRRRGVHGDPVADLRAGTRRAAGLPGPAHAPRPGRSVTTGSSASRGPRRWITRHTVAGETPNSGASCRIVRFVR